VLCFLSSALKALNILSAIGDILSKRIPIAFGTAESNFPFKHLKPRGINMRISGTF
jgi:hypothetical protein